MHEMEVEGGFFWEKKKEERMEVVLTGDGTRACCTCARAHGNEPPSRRRDPTPADGARRQGAGPLTTGPVVGPVHEDQTS